MEKHINFASEILKILKKLQHLFKCNGMMFCKDLVDALILYRIVSLILKNSTVFSSNFNIDNHVYQILPLLLKKFTKILIGRFLSIENQIL